jgi:hypothetical protein
LSGTPYNNDKSALEHRANRSETRGDTETDVEADAADAAWEAEMSSGKLLSKRQRRLRRRRRRQALALGLLAFVGLSIYAVHRHLLAAKRAPALPPVSAPSYPDPPGIVLHDSDTPGRIGGNLFNAARLEEIHAHDHPDWAVKFEGKTYHIGYHYVILPDGTIEPGRPVRCPGAHTKMYNNWIGVCVVGGFSTHRHWWPTTPTPKQMAAVTSLCEQLMSQYHIPPDRVKRHRDLRMTYCPGDRFPYTEILRSLRRYAATHPETQPSAGHLVSLTPRLKMP